MFDQYIYVCNATASKIFVRAIYEKWQAKKFTAEVSLPSGVAISGGLEFENDKISMTDGFTVLAPHHSLKMVGSFFSSWVSKANLPPESAEKLAPRAGKTDQAESPLIRICRDYRVPTSSAIIVTPQYSLQAVTGKWRWKNRCKEICPCMFGEKKRPFQRGKTGQKKLRPACPVCGREQRVSSESGRDVDNN